MQKNVLKMIAGVTGWGKKAADTAFQAERSVWITTKNALAQVCKGDVTFLSDQVEIKSLIWGLGLSDGTAETMLSDTDVPL